MKNNIAKNILKVVAATAMIGAVVIGGSKMTAKAGSYEEDMAQFCKMKGCTEEQIDENLIDGDGALFEEFCRWSFSINYPGEDYDVVTEIALRELAGMGIITDANELLKDMTIARSGMLAKVNTDRKNNSAEPLVLNGELEAIARQRALEIMDNVQTEEFEAARVSGNTAETNRIIHQGYILMENAIVSAKSGITMETADNNWINSEGHHAQRIRAEWTKYACASYTDPVTGMEVWVEVFADNSFKGVSSFDYIRYAADYPDLAAALGQDRNALYKHYLTCGKNEGRKAYNTDGTQIG